MPTNWSLALCRASRQSDFIAASTLECRPRHTSGTARAIASAADLLVAVFWRTGRVRHCGFDAMASGRMAEGLDARSMDGLDRRLPGDLAAGVRSGPVWRASIGPAV